MELGDGYHVANLETGILKSAGQTVLGSGRAESGNPAARLEYIEAGASPLEPRNGAIPVLTHKPALGPTLAHLIPCPSLAIGAEAVGWVSDNRVGAGGLHGPQRLDAIGLDEVSPHRRSPV